MARITVKATPAQIAQLDEMYGLDEAALEDAGLILHRACLGPFFLFQIADEDWEKGRARLRRRSDEYVERVTAERAARPKKKKPKKK